MRALWLAPLLLCFILSSVSALCPTGCKTCDYLVKCTSCERGYVLYNSQCGQCASGCDKCKVTKTQGNQYWTQCTGSCQNGCTKCNSDYTCAQCGVGYGLYDGQCRSCQGDCDKCYFTPTGDGSSAWITCTGSCKGGCDACSNGNTCTRCRSGYVLNNGVCYACNGCSECKYIQATSNSWRTECVASATPTPTPTPTNNNNNNFNNNNSKNDLYVLVIVGLVALGTAAFFVIKRSKESQRRNNMQQDYIQAMAIEKQRQAALNIPTPNYQYQAPQAYPQAYPQGYPQGNQPVQPRY